jgi:hypothetical protein
MHDEAIEAQRIAAEASPGFRFGLGYAYARAGRDEDARQIAAAIEDTEPPDTWGLAEIYAALGDDDVAIGWLQAGVEERRDWISQMQQNTAYRPLFGDPRFKELLRQLRLPDLTSVP